MAPGGGRTGTGRLPRLARGLAEHACSAFARVAGRRYFDAGHFDRVYAAADPWGYATSPYEAARRAALLAALPRRRYGAVLEVGCGEGHTTRHLAARAGRIVGLDVSAAAVARARRVGLPPNATIVQGDLLGPLSPHTPPGGFDLVVCAEVLYYCYRLPVGATCRLVRDRLVGWLASGGDLVLLHPLHHPAHTPFDRLAARAASLIRLARTRVALTPRPITIATYRRPDPETEEHENR